jgi:beta-galactosidase beta subunit
MKQQYKKVEIALRYDTLLDDVLDFIENISDIKINSNFNKKFDKVCKLIKELYKYSIEDNTNIINDNLTYIVYSLKHKLNKFEIEELYYKCHKVQLLISEFEKYPLLYATDYI